VVRGSELFRRQHRKRMGGVTEWTDLVSPKVIMGSELGIALKDSIVYQRLRISPREAKLSKGPKGINMHTALTPDRQESGIFVQR
jgi:hypothetical protein